jgi:orotidine-5'-phosphate decarboxylase
MGRAWTGASRRTMTGGRVAQPGGDVMRDRIIVALDMSSGHEALGLARQLGGHARWLKVGLTLFCAEGPAIVGTLRELGFDVFVDLKLHDIPHQVEGAATTLSTLGVGMLTVHASGGRDMMRAALHGCAQGAARAGSTPAEVLAVTVLTSTDDAMLASLGLPRSAAEQVGILSDLAKEAGVAGVVCSPLEARAARTFWGGAAPIVTPGVRPRRTSSDDQRRVLTPAEALSEGASHIVVGRPITAAADPLAAFEAIFETTKGIA